MVKCFNFFIFVKNSVLNSVLYFRYAKRNEEIASVWQMTETLVPTLLNSLLQYLYL